MSNRFPKLSKTEIEIIRSAFFYGRGYMTAELANYFVNLKHQDSVYKVLRKLEEKKIFKHILLGRYKIFFLTKTGIIFIKTLPDLVEYFDVKNIAYLARLEAGKKDSIQVIENKLRQLQYWAENYHRDITVILGFEKTTYFTDKLQFVESDFDSFRINKGPIFFNDCMFQDEDNIFNIILFPMDEIFAETFIKNFLIRQYHRLFFLLRSKNIQFKIQLIFSTESQRSKYQFQLDKKVGYNSNSILRDEYEYYNYNPQTKIVYLPIFTMDNRSMNFLYE
jgi:hypothetical protein